LFAQESLPVRILPLPDNLDPDSYVFKNGPELFKEPWETAQPFLAYLLEELIREHGLDIDGRLRVLGEFRPAFQSLTDPVERDLWLRFAAGRLTLDEGSLRQSLAVSASTPFARLTPGRKLAVNLERNLLRYILHHPTSVSLSELEEWAQEVEGADFREIMDLIVSCRRTHGALDLGLLIQGVEEENLRQQICALALEEAVPAGEPGYDLAGEWRRALDMRRLEKARQALTAQLAQMGSQENGEELLVLMAQKQEVDRQLEALKSQGRMRGEGG
jgi:DNA primase